MNRQEAQQILSLYRPDGADALDPTLAEALSLARTDPELARWFAAQLRFDREIARQLQVVMPPERLRDETCAGMRLQTAGRRVPRGWLAFGVIVALVALAAVAELFAHHGEIPANGLSP